MRPLFVVTPVCLHVRFQQVAGLGLQGDILIEMLKINILLAVEPDSQRVFPLASHRSVQGNLGTGNPGHPPVKTTSGDLFSFQPLHWYEMLSGRFLQFGLPNPERLIEFRVRDEEFDVDECIIADNFLAERNFRVPHFDGRIFVAGLIEIAEVLIERGRIPGYKLSSIKSGSSTARVQTS